MGLAGGDTDQHGRGHFDPLFGGKEAGLTLEAIHGNCTTRFVFWNPLARFQMEQQGT